VNSQHSKDAISSDVFQVGGYFCYRESSLVCIFKEAALRSSSANTCSKAGRSPTSTAKIVIPPLLCVNPQPQPQQQTENESNSALHAMDLLLVDQTLHPLNPKSKLSKLRHQKSKTHPNRSLHSYYKAILYLVTTAPTLHAEVYH
jgi:hypothetical protein